MDISRSEARVYIRKTLLDAVNVLLLLHHTSADGDKHIAVLLLLSLICAEIAEQTDVGIFSDRTCVKDEKVR